MANEFYGSTDGDWDKAANWSLNRVPLATDDVVIEPAMASNPWDTGPASPVTVKSFSYSDEWGMGGPHGDFSKITVTGDVTWYDLDYAQDLAAFGGKFTARNVYNMQAIDVGTQAQGDVEVYVITGGDTFQGTVPGTFTIHCDGPAGSCSGTLNGPVVVTGSGGEPAYAYDFSGAALAGADSLTVNGGMFAGGTWPNVSVTVNSGIVCGGTFQGPVTFKSGSYCGHPDSGDEPEFDNTVTFESGAQINEINADGDTVFESASWSLSAQGYWPWDFQDVYVEGGDLNLTAEYMEIKINGKVYPEDDTITPKLEVQEVYGGTSKMEVDMSELPAPAGGGGGMLMPL